mmetsp:Transcript_22888/g.71320  ORF Transcript_22888/g.71320 Transcript_22888/m.71320 type:complete len:297 (+) Transcript_22888:175-1065(+)
MRQLSELLVAAEDGLSLMGNHTSNWWDDINNSKEWQERTFLTLSSLYGIIALVTMIQLVIIHIRIPQYRWTTQKVFYLLNFTCMGLRSGVFSQRVRVASLSPAVLGDVLLDLPGLLYFSTYTLLVLFYAEIYQQARRQPSSHLRPLCVGVNAVVYVVQAGLWVLVGVYPGAHMAYRISSGCFIAAVSVAAAVGFLLYGGRLIIILRSFPLESEGRQKKLREVGCVTAICCVCFTARAGMVAYNAINSGAGLDVLNHPVLNFVYYLLVEIVPSALVLFTLRKLPPRRTPEGYQPIEG